MNTDTLEKVLSCDRLPSLPAVAVRVIELMQKQDVSFKDLAETIHNDQALAAKVIRTVNSSFFGLRQRCSSINQAIVLLGLSAVKTLALGFSLVSAISGTEEKGATFDYVSYWRRSLYTGIAARTLAKQAGTGCEEECFLGGLLQDVGMIALYQALRGEYGALLREAGPDHRRLAQLEIAALDVQHADIGALLASRWKLPAELVMPIKYHERPSAAPASHQQMVRAVALGNIAADLLSAAEPAGLLQRFYAKAAEWFDMSPPQAEDVLRSISVSTKEVARLLQINAGDIADADAILEQAHERLLKMTIAAPGSALDASGDVDPLTGLPSRRSFGQSLIAAFEQSVGAGVPMALALFDVDGLDAINKAGTRSAGDAALAALAEQLQRETAFVGAAAFRLECGRLAAIFPRIGRLEATRVAESVRRHFHAGKIGTGAGPGLTASVSVGLTWLDPANSRGLGSAAELIDVTERALAAAKLAGCNTIRLYTPPSAAAA